MCLKRQQADFPGGSPVLPTPGTACLPGVTYLPVASLCTPWRPRRSVLTDPGCLRVRSPRMSLLLYYIDQGQPNLKFPWWLSSKEPACLCGRCSFDPWVGKIPWRREWQPTSVFLPGESHGQRSLAGYSLWGPKSRTQLSE